jgi:ElaB/YqjD/DUF883 family membrane-anchored ribosome-binding protein
MEKYNETNIDVLLEKELNKLNGLVKKIEETNENVLKNSSIIDEIKQKYDDITRTISDFKSRLTVSTNSGDFVNIEAFKTHKEEIDAQLTQIKRAQINLNNQLKEFDNVLKEFKPKIDESFNERINRFVSIDSFENRINDLERTIEKTITDSIDSIEIEKIKSSLNTVIKDVDDVFKPAEVINRNKIVKLEANTNDNLQKMKDQIDELTPKIEDSINEKTGHFVNIDAFEKKINDLQSTIEKTIQKSVGKIEIEEIKNSLNLVIKDVDDIYRLAGEIDKERISKFEARTSDNFRKINDQIMKFSLNVNLQSDKFQSIKNEQKTFISLSKLYEFETKILDKTNYLNKEIENIKQQNEQLIKQQNEQLIKHNKGQNVHNIFFITAFVIFAIFIVIALNK